MSGSSGGNFGRPPEQQPLPPQAHVRSPRRSSVGFTIFLAVAMLLGACAMAFILLASGAPNALVIGTVLAALPLGPLIACFMWLDRYEPEPRALILAALGWGAVVATTIAFFLQLIDQVAFSTSAALSGSIVAPLTEEAAKGIFVVLLLFARRHELDGILDGIVYAGMVGIGFAFTENILYLASAYMGGDGIGPGGIEAATGTFVERGIFSPFAHPFFTALIGVGVGYAVVTRSGLWRVIAPVLGYGAAVLAHALWNGSLFLGGGQFFVLAYVFAMVLAFLMFVGFAVWARRREGQMLTRALNDCAARGFLGYHEVPWLVRLPARRESRRFAKEHGGPEALRAMREYQQQAVELGFLHDRYLRGTAPPDFAERGQAMVDHMSALQPNVRFPQLPGRTLPNQGAPLE
ncbi:MAG: PrsW family intramembrane metalloprotease, partial [Actinomycetes bacterium]